MKNVILLVALILLPLNVQARKITDDQLILGKPGSSSDIEIKSEDGNNILKINRGAGSWQFSNDAGVNFLDIGSGGGGAGGGINLLTNPNMEQGLTGWTNSGGVLSEITDADALEGKKSLNFTFGGQANYVESATVVVNAGLYGNACEARVFYKGSGPNNSIQVLNADDEILADVVTPTHSIANYESAYFRCPTEEVVTSTEEKGILRLRITQTGTVSQPIDFDVTHLGSTIGLVTIVDAEVEEKILSADVTTDGDIADWTFTGLEIGKTYKLTGTIFTEDTSSVVNEINVYSGASGTGTIYGKIHYNNGANAQRVAIGVSIVFIAESTTMYVNGSSIQLIRGDGTKEESFLQLRRLVERQVFKNIPRVADNVNEFSASTSDSVGTISEESPVDWINGNCGLVSTNYTCNFNAGIFSEAPICFATGARNGVTGQDMIIQSVSASQVVVSGSVNGAFNLNCKKKGTDYKTPTVQPVVVNQVVTNSGDPVKICRLFQVSNSSTPSYESPDDCYKTLSRTATGQHNFEFKDGYFKSGSSASCWALAIDNGALQGDISIESAGSIGKVPVDSSFDVQVYTTNGAASADRGFNLICLGDA